MVKKIINGNFIFTKDKDGFTCLENHYIVIDGGKIEGIFVKLPDKYAKYPIEKFDGLIIPGFVDLHLHASQYENMGLGMDDELLPWLNKYTFPEEARFEDEGYAAEVYGRFAEELGKSGITRCAVYGTVHKKATEILASLIEKAGPLAYVGKVCMDRNTAPELSEETERSVAETESFVSELGQGRVKPIITPRFVPSCSEKLMEGLGRLAAKYGAPVQSHLSENRDEIKWVSRLHPQCEAYGHVYDKYGLFGQTPTIMAHCVYSYGAEAALIKERGVFVAHCPASNANMASGIAPVKDFLASGIKVGLGSDISGGHTLWMPALIIGAVQLSNMRAVNMAEKAEKSESSNKGVSVMGNALSLSEAFYMATKGGGEFFGSVGSFEAGYDFDALFIDDTRLLGKASRPLTERLSRFIYAGSRQCIVKRFAAGREI